MSDSLAAAARECLLAAIHAVDPRELTMTALRGWTDGVAGGSVEVVAAGKAAAGMLRGASESLGGALRGGVLIAPGASPALPPGVVAFRGGHPMPNEDGARGAAVMVRSMAGLDRDARVLVLLSGGASALMTLPADGVTLADMVAASKALMGAGADIRELNCVRKHLDRLKGGMMAKLLERSRVRALVLSDVIGDPLDVIGSGPLVPDPTTYDDAIAVLRGRHVWDVVPQSVRDHLLAGNRGEHPETPKAGDPCFANVEIEIIGNNALAVQGAAAEARSRGFEVSLVETPIEGEARDAGSAFARKMLDVRSAMSDDRPRCIVGGGETTVTVTGAGVGGRNLEFAAAAAIVVDGVRGIVVGSLGTDGADGPTDAAGAVADGDTLRAARARGVDLAAALAENDTLRAMDAAGAVVRTGPTGTNAMDVQLGMVQPDRRASAIVA